MADLDTDKIFKKSLILESKVVKMKNEIILDQEKVQVELEKGYVVAKKLLEDYDKIERFLQRLEKKLLNIPVVGDKLAHIPIMISLIRSYVKKEYTDIPLASIIAIVSALIYVLSPIDMIPDFIPGIGYADDAAIIALCWKSVGTDVDNYKLWRDNNGKTII